VTPPTRTLVLASASPARARTLTCAGVRFETVVSQVDEAEVARRAEAVTGAALDPVDLALLLARAKAEDVAYRSELPADALVLGCDSILDVDGQVHGKPAGPEQAAARLARLSGRSAVLHTGHWLIDADHPTGRAAGAVGSTTVYFADLDPDEIAAYVATGEPLQVAGAFTVDGLGGAFVRGVEGDHHTVVGVSLPLLRGMIRDFGLSWQQLWVSR
jgi:septum formation protein